MEDPEDLYNHSKQFYKSTEAAKDYDHQVEIGERKIKGDPAMMMNDLDHLVYGGKKTSRAKMQQAEDDDSEDDNNDMDIDEDEDEDIDSDEYGQDVNSDDVGEEQEDDDDSNVEESEVDEDDDDIEEQIVTKASTKKQQIPAKNKQTPQIQNQDQDNLDMALNQLKQEEKEDSKYIQKRMSSDIQKAKSVKTQKKIFDQFLHQRILMQKLLQHGNMLPTADMLELFVKHSKSTEINALSCKRNIKRHLKDQIKLQKQLFHLSETSIKLQEVQSTKDNSDNEDISADKLFKVIDGNFQEMMPFVEETIDRWNNRTMMIKNLGGNQSKSKAFGKTILEQVNSIFNEQDSRQKLREKSNLKRDHYRILGRKADDLANEKDPNIFNDFDFYQVLLKDFLANADGSGADGDDKYNATGGGDDDMYLDGADLGLTQKYLERKRKLQMNKGEKMKKDVDRKASKNRKIRYIVHEKIVNFMTPHDNNNIDGIYDGRDSVLLSLFGQNANNNLQNGDGTANQNGGKKSKKQQKNEIEEGGIKLI
eukprot:403351797